MTDDQGRWAEDPTGRHELRWFDGSEWSDHVSDAGVTSIDPVATEDGRAAGSTPVASAPPQTLVDANGIEAARARMRMRLGAGREIKKLSTHLWEDERVESMTGGAYAGGSGLLVLTDRRLLFLREAVMSRATEDFPLHQISSIQWSSGMVTGTMTVFASGTKAEIKNVNKDDGKAIVDLVRARISQPSEPSRNVSVTPVAQAPVSDTQQPVLEQLRQLAQLRDAGVVTAEEFEAKKADLLSRL